VPSPRRSFVPDGVAPPFGDGYVHAVVAGGAIYVSGQFGVDPDGTIPEGFDAQARRAFANLEAILAAAGAQLADVVCASRSRRSRSPASRRAPAARAARRPR
jgi:2-iminobutanoate/2-iminopropanoate deaminase